MFRYPYRRDNPYLFPLLPFAFLSPSCAVSLASSGRIWPFQEGRLFVYVYETDWPDSKGICRGTMLKPLTAFVHKAHCTSSLALNYQVYPLPS